MSVGFRKSLFGFNSSDVMEYIEKSQKSFAQKEKELSNQVEGLKNDLYLSNENYKALLFEKEVVEKKLAEFNEKYEEIERLSENIGKLYLVAQANAQAIMSSTERNAQMTNSEVERNLATISEAHDSLGELKKNILETSNQFVAEVDELIASLDRTRETVAENIASNMESKKKYDEIYDSIVR